MIYLASPYSHPDPTVEEIRFDQVCQAAADLLQQGHDIFSPIAHTHPIKLHGLDGGWEFWAAYDRWFIERCDELWILVLDGWTASVGVSAEREVALSLGKPVRFVHVKTLEIIPSPDDSFVEMVTAYIAAKPPEVQQRILDALEATAPEEEQP